MSGHAVVIGGANLDILARSDADVILATSNPGDVRMSAGGVGRNIAENLARLGTPTHLVADLGTDLAGDQVWEATAAAGVQMDLVRRTSPTTGLYVVTLDVTGEMIVAVSQMETARALGTDRVDHALTLIRDAGVVILDGNLAPATVERALEVAADYATPVILDPVSVPKASLLAAALITERPVHTVTPNRDELAALTGATVGSDEAVETAARHLLARGVARVWVRLGHRGSALITADATTWLPASTTPVDVVDVTGAGDALLAGYAHALLSGQPEAAAAAYGHRVATLTVASRHTVRPDLCPDLVRSVE